MSGKRNSDGALPRPIVGALVLGLVDLDPKQRRVHWIVRPADVVELPKDVVVPRCARNGDIPVGRNWDTITRQRR